MAALPAFRRLAEEYAAAADFVLVYVDEAHPADGWAACSPFQLPRHRTLADRLSAAALLLRHFRLEPWCRVVADSMDNQANRAYGVASERFCIVHWEKVAHLGGRGPFFYSLAGVKTWLERHRGGQE